MNFKEERDNKSDAPSSVKQVYLAMHENVAITHRGLESKLGLSKTTIRKANATLIQRKLIRRVGPCFGVHWEIVKLWRKRHEWFIGQFEKG